MHAGNVWVWVSTKLLGAVQKVKGVERPDICNPQCPVTQDSGEAHRGTVGTVRPRPHWICQLYST